MKHIINERNIIDIEDLRYILKRMFWFAGYNYDEKLLDDPWWFRTISWTERRERLFMKWLYLVLFFSKRYRILLFKKLNITNNSLKSAVNIFILRYGWSRKNGYRSPMKYYI